MHELGAALELFKVVEEKGKENNLKKVTKVTVKVGEASGIESDFLRHSFLDHIFPGTIADGADLEIVIEKVAEMCKDCETKIDVSKDEPVMKCPSCGSSKFEITGGKDIYVDSIEGE